MKKLILAAAALTGALLAAPAHAATSTSNNCAFYTTFPSAASLVPCVYGTGTVNSVTAYWPYQQLWDGVNTITVKAGSTAPASTDTALVVTTRDAVSIAPSQVIGATQSGTWSTGRTWSLSSAADSVTIGGTLPAFASTPTVNAAQSGTWTVTGAGGTFPVTGTFWQTTQPVSLASLPALATGSATIGSIANTSFGISGALPAFASTPTVNLGTLNGAATAANQTAAQGSNGSTAPGSTVQVGGVNPAGNLAPNYLDPCSSGKALQLAVNITTGNGSAYITGVSGKSIYVCGGSFMASAASVMVVFENSSASCSAETAYIIGNTISSPTQGLAFGANGGIQWTPSGHTHFATANTGDSLCFLAASAGVSGEVQYVIQ